MAAYLERIAAAGFYELDAILAEADRDRAITDAQAEYIRLKATERGTRLLFAHA